MNKEYSFLRIYRNSYLDILRATQFFILNQIKNNQKSESTALLSSRSIKVFDKPTLDQLLLINFRFAVLFATQHLWPQRRNNNPSTPLPHRIVLWSFRSKMADSIANYKGIFLIKIHARLNISVCSLLLDKQFRDQ